MRRIPCACSRCVEQLSKPWLPNLGKTQQPRYVIEPETCKYSSILQGYNKWYIAKLSLKKETIKPDEMKIKYELVLQGMTQAAADEIEYNTISDLFHPKTSNLSTRAIIWVHFKTVHYFSQSIFSLFSYLKDAYRNLFI